MIAGPFQIEEKFKIAGRGTVVVIDQTTALPVGNVLLATLTLPDGTRVQAHAHKEWLLRRTSKPIEKEAFLLQGLEMDHVLDGSTIELHSS